MSEPSLDPTRLQAVLESAIRRARNAETAHRAYSTTQHRAAEAREEIAQLRSLAAALPALLESRRRVQELEAERNGRRANGGEGMT